jgi:hypothetical protein
LAHRHRAIVKAAPFAVAANLPLASARCAHRCLGAVERPSLRLGPLPLLAQSGHHDRAARRPFGVGHSEMSAFDRKRTLAAHQRG